MASWPWFSIGRACTALLLFAHAPAIPAVLDSEQRASERAFKLVPDVEVSLTAPGEAPRRVTGTFSIKDRLFSIGERSSSEGQAGARGAAKVELVRESPRSIEVRLNARANALGEAEAAGEAKATLEVTVPPDMKHLPVVLRLIADNPSDLSVSVRTNDGSVVQTMEASPGQYLLDTDAASGFTIQSNVRVRDTDKSRGAERATVNLRALLEAGPILHANSNRYILRGDQTESFAQVGSLLKDGKLHCTATLVAPKTLLTAAHCVAGYEGQIEKGRFEFAIGPRSSNPQVKLSVASADYPKDRRAGFFYVSGEYADDIALVYLATAPAIQPASLHEGPPDWLSLKAEKLVFVGFGFNGNVSDSAGVKRQAAWKIDTVEERKILWNTTTASTCQFDSGGPAFREASLMVVAVTSKGAQDCSRGVDTRVDAFLPWLRGKLR